MGPLFSLGLLLVGCFSAIHFSIHFKLRRNGYKNTGMLLGIPDQIEYMKVRKRHGWPVWPVYVMWFCLIAGVILIVLGIFKQ